MLMCMVGFFVPGKKRQSRDCLVLAQFWSSLKGSQIRFGWCKSFRRLLLIAGKTGGAGQRPAEAAN